MRDSYSVWRASSNLAGLGSTGYLRSALDGQNSASFGSEEKKPGGNGDTDSADGVLIRRLNRESKRPDRQRAGGDRQHSRSAARDPPPGGTACRRGYADYPPTT